jgi:predicted aconitase
MRSGADFARDENLGCSLPGKQTQERTMQVRIAGLPWFSEDDYESFRPILPDRQWHATYALWLAAAQKTEERIQQSGIVTVKAHVRSDTFVAWCRSTGRDVNTKALVAFGNEAALRVYRGDKGH